MTRLHAFPLVLALTIALPPSPRAAAQPAAAPKAPPPAAQPAKADPPKPAPAKPDATKPAAAKPAPGPPGAWHINAYGLFAFQQFAAKESFEAVFGHSSRGHFGGGAQVWHRSGLFAQAEYSQVKDDGQRVFVSGGTIYPLAIPLHVEIGTFEVGVGYKFVRKVRAPKPPSAPKAPAAPPARKGDDGVLVQRQPARPAAPPARAKAPSRFRLTPYLGAGFGRTSYAERGDFASGGENPSGSYNSYHAVAGIEVPLMKWIGVNVEGFYRWVPNALGKDGVSAEFDDTDLGGPALRVKLTVGR